jgi:hypothetical protein
MRWFRRGQGARQAQHDPGRRAALLDEARHRFGGHLPAPYAEQADQVTRLLDGDDGLFAAADILREFADAAHADLLAQAGELYRRTGHGLPVDRRNYRPLWSAAGPHLRWRLFELPCGWHPYAQVAGAVAVLGAGARRYARLTDPEPALAHLFEVLDLILAGWEFGRVRVDADAATLVDGLISAARQVRADMPQEPPPLPPPVRELMRRNNTLDVHGGGNRVVGTINPGRELREALLA